MSETKSRGENFCVDAITWNDLDLDAVLTQSTTQCRCAGRISVHGASDAGHNNRNQGRAGMADEAFAENQKPEKQCRKHFFDGKEKMNPPTEEIAVLMEAEPGEKGNIF